MFITGYWVHGEHANIVARIDGRQYDKKENGDQVEMILFSIANTFNEAAGWNSGGGLPADTFEEIYPDGPYEAIPMAPKELIRGGLCGDAWREGFDPIKCNKDQNHEGRHGFEW